MLNLNNAADFAKLTLSSASNALTQLAGLSASEWDIEEGAYGHPDANPSQPVVLFHVFRSPLDYGGAVDSITDQGGRRKVPFVFPYVDGQTTDDLGRKGEAFEINILLHGPNYRKAYTRLLKELNDARPGTLVHPVRGRVKVAAQDWTVTHSSDHRQAVALKVSFIEHNFDVSFQRVSVLQQNTVKSAITNALSYVGKIAAVITKVQANITVVQNFKTLATATLNDYSALFGSTLTKLNKTFSDGDTSDLPALLPVNSGIDSFPVAGTKDPFSETTAIVQAESVATLAAQQAIDVVKALRIQLNETIEIFGTITEGELIFHDEILELKRSSIAMQETLELGLQSSRAAIASYTLPRVMSLREVAFANGLTPDRAGEIELLNPSILSTNMVARGTILKVPTE